jgi:choline kinase
MKVVILAAGQGTRLRPLTNDRPKCLVELEGKPLLEHQLDVYEKLGLQDLHVVGGYRANQLTHPKLTLHINEAFATTNMVATLFCAADLFCGEEDVIIAYGDIVFEEHVLSKLLECDAEIALAIDKEWQRYWSSRMEDPLSDAETLKINEQGNIFEVGKKPDNYDDIQGQYVGLIKVRADKAKEFVQVRQNMARDAVYDGQDYANMYMTSYLQFLIDQGWEARAVEIENCWAEIDSAEDLEAATKYWTPA